MALRIWVSSTGKTHLESDQYGRPGELLAWTICGLQIRSIIQEVEPEFLDSIFKSICRACKYSRNAPGELKSGR